MNRLILIAALAAPYAGPVHADFWNAMWKGSNLYQRTHYVDTQRLCVARAEREHAKRDLTADEYADIVNECCLEHKCEGIER